MNADRTKQRRRTATNWTMDGLPIEGGFAVAAADACPECGAIEGCDCQTTTASRGRTASRRRASFDPDTDWESKTRYCGACGYDQRWQTSEDCPACRGKGPGWDPNGREPWWDDRSQAEQDEINRSNPMAKNARAASFNPDTDWDKKPRYCGMCGYDEMWATGDDCPACHNGGPGRRDGGDGQPWFEDRSPEEQAQIKADYAKSKEPGPMFGARRIKRAGYDYIVADANVGTCPECGSTDTQTMTECINCGARFYPHEGRPASRKQADGEDGTGKKCTSCGSKNTDQSSLGDWDCYDCGATFGKQTNASKTAAIGDADWGWTEAEMGEDEVWTGHDAANNEVFVCEVPQLDGGSKWEWWTEHSDGTIESPGYFDSRDKAIEDAEERFADVTASKTAESSFEDEYKCVTCGKPATYFAYEEGSRASGHFCCDEHKDNFAEGRTVEKIGSKTAFWNDDDEWEGPSGDPWSMPSNGLEPPQMTPGERYIAHFECDPVDCGMEHSPHQLIVTFVSQSGDRATLREEDGTEFEIYTYSPEQGDARWSYGSDADPLYFTSGTYATRKTAWQEGDVVQLKSDHVDPDGGGSWEAGSTGTLDYAMDEGGKTMWGVTMDTMSDDVNGNSNDEIVLYEDEFTKLERSSSRKVAIGGPNWEEEGDGVTWWYQGPQVVDDGSIVSTIELTVEQIGDNAWSYRLVTFDQNDNEWGEYEAEDFSSQDAAFAAAEATVNGFAHIAKRSEPVAEAALSNADLFEAHTETYSKWVAATSDGNVREAAQLRQTFAALDAELASRGLVEAYEQVVPVKLYIELSNTAAEHPGSLTWYALDNTGSSVAEMVLSEKTAATEIHALRESEPGSAHWLLSRLADHQPHAILNVRQLTAGERELFNGWVAGTPNVELNGGLHQLGAVD